MPSTIKKLTWTVVDGIGTSRAFQYHYTIEAKTAINDAGELDLLFTTTTTDLFTNNTDSKQSTTLRDAKAVAQAHFAAEVNKYLEAL